MALTGLILILVCLGIMTGYPIIKAANGATPLSVFLNNINDKVYATAGLVTGIAGLILTALHFLFGW